MSKKEKEMIPYLFSSPANQTFQEEEEQEEEISPPPPTSPTPPTLQHVLENMWERNGKKNMGWDLDHSVFCRNGVMLHNLIIKKREGVVDDFIMNFSYSIYHSSNVGVFRVVNLSSFSAAVQFLWRFLDDFVVCHECTALVKKTDTVSYMSYMSYTTHNNNKDSDAVCCLSCMFFKQYMEFHAKKTEICAICLDPVYRFSLPCGHMFHRLCLMKTAKRSHMRCAMCRQRIPQHVLDYIYEIDFYDRHNGKEQVHGGEDNHHDDDDDDDGNNIENVHNNDNNYEEEEDDNDSDENV